MCGVAGIVQRRASTTNDLRGIISAMTSALAHRGPDGSGIWTDLDHGVALGHRRLSIIDLTPAGAQPMVSADGRYVVTFNGEIFNYLDLRKDLVDAGVSFRGNSDTEVMLAGFSYWGIPATVSKLIGMFAAGVWDREARSSWLIRDRLGVKPLYYAHNDQFLIFGSELKALRACPGWDTSINRDALVAYLRHGYVPAPSTIYAEARKLEPGRLLECGPDNKLRLHTYWDVREKARLGAGTWSRAIRAEDVVDELEALLRDAVRLRMISDVPLGAFLSGGIDSSTVVALMQAQSSRAVKTFSIGFDAAGYDEAKHAAAVASHLGTDHTELYVEPGHALEVVPLLANIYDEPFADSSQIPTYLVSKMTRQHVTVALSGDGGDENFAGYNRYTYAGEIWNRVGRLPAGIRRLAADMLCVPGAGTYDALNSLLPSRFRPVRPAEKVGKLAEVLRLESLEAVYRRLVSQWASPLEVAAGGNEPLGALWDETLAADVRDPVSRMQLLDMLTYLPDDILTKVDRATMAVALEGRVPLLDHRVVEYAWTLPPSLKLRNGETKWVLRRVLERYVPRSLFERPKMGFGVPIDSWLRGPLREWAEELLDPKAMACDGLLRPEPIASAWRLHKSGQSNLHYPLWVILMFRAWQQRWC